MAEGDIDRVVGTMHDTHLMDPHGTLLHRDGLTPSEVAEVEEVMRAMTLWSRAESRQMRTMRAEMELGERDMHALRFIMAGQRAGLVVTPAMLAAHLDVTTAAVTKLLDRLQAGGHVVRDPHPSDRRAMALHVTEETMVRARHTVGVPHARRFASAARLSSAERDTVVRFLHDLADPDSADTNAAPQPPAAENDMSPAPPPATDAASVAAAELVVLLDDSGTPIGTADKATVHTSDTPLHLAFSCHIRDPHGRVLVTRRALSKVTWPGVWTNSVCGHPAPDESFEAAIARRAEHELGVRVRDIEPLLPEFRYEAIDASGIREFEICPVFSAVTSDEPQPNPEEVAEYQWAASDDLDRAVAGTPWAFSPWFVEQLDELRRAESGPEPEPGAASDADGAEPTHVA